LLQLLALALMLLPSVAFALLQLLMLLLLAAVTFLNAGCSCLQLLPSTFSYATAANGYSYWLVLLVAADIGCSAAVIYCCSLLQLFVAAYSRLYLFAINYIQVLAAAGSCYLFFVACSCLLLAAVASS